MAGEFGRYAIIVQSSRPQAEVARRLERAKAELGSLSAPIMGGTGLYVIGVVTDWTASEIYELIAAPGVHVAVLSIGREVAIPEPLGGKFIEIMSQTPAWKSRRDEDW